MIFHWLFCIQNHFFFPTCGSWLETAFKFGGCATYFDPSRAKLSLAPLGSLTLNE